MVHGSGSGSAEVRHLVLCPVCHPPSAIVCTCFELTSLVMLFGFLSRALRRRRPPESTLEDRGDTIEGETTKGSDVDSFEVDASTSRYDDEDADEDTCIEDEDNVVDNCTCVEKLLPSLRIC